MLRILAINPGASSTKIAIFDGEELVVEQSLRHELDDLSVFDGVAGQAGFRHDCVLKFLGDNNIVIDKLNAVIGRGGLLKPIECGVYEVNESMLADLASGEYGVHSSNLGGIIARKIADEAGCRAFIADPVVSDEMDDVARISGHPLFVRRSIFHALNQKSTAREVAGKIGKAYEACNFIVVHLGSGVSVGAHCKGRVVDVNNALDGEGAFSPERSGTLPTGALVDLCFSGEYTRDEVRKMLTGKGGLVAYLGTNSISDIMDEADREGGQAKLLSLALAYQVSQEICRHGATMFGEIDRIILTGGMAHERRFITLISDRVSWLAEVEVIPGEREMLSLARGALSVLDGRINAKIYE